MHALTDYALQPEWMGSHKRPHQPQDLDKHLEPWWWSMGAHGLLNGLGVWVITQSVLLGVLETAVHFLLDTAKAQGDLTMQQDQYGHWASKVGWAWLSTH